MSSRLRLAIGMAFVLLGLIAVATAVGLVRASWWLHGTWCFVGLILIAVAVRRAFLMGFKVVLKDHFVMLSLAFAAYFLFGALLPVIGPADEIQYSLAYYPVSPADALRVDGVNAIGFGIALLVGALTSGRLFTSATRRVSRLSSKVGPKSAIIAFFVIGGLASAYVASADLGLRPGSVSGAWRLLSQLVLVAIFLGGAYQGRGERSMLMVAVLAAVFKASLGLLLLYKANVLLPIGALVAAFSIRYQNRLVLLVGIGGMAILFVSLGSYVAFGRDSFSGSQGGSVAVMDRVSISAQGLGLVADPTFRSTYSPWARISYLPAQTAGMHFFESGRGGDDLTRIPWLFVPRVMAPNKPSITQTGSDFHTKITGQGGSSTGQGIFISAYYNAGWFGLIVISAICGWILVQTSAMSRVILRRQDALLFPFALLGVYMAFRIDGHFISDYFGAFVFVLYALVAGYLLSSLFLSQRLRLQ